MKTPARPLFFAAVASFLTLTLAAWAQDKSGPPQADPSTASVQTAPAAASTEAAPASTATTVPQTPAAEKPTASTPAEPASPSAAAAPDADKSALRRLDQPSSADAKTPDTAAESAGETVSDTPNQAVDAAPGAPVAPAAPASPDKPKPQSHRHGSFNRQAGNERVSFWHDSTLAADEQAGAVVSIFGSSTSAGTVSDAVVSVFGSSTSSGEVGNAVVSVFGNTRVTGGSVGDAAVAVFGNNYVNAKINRDVVAVFGNVELGPDAEVSGNIVCVGGTVNRDVHAVVHGQVNNVAFGPHFSGFDWLHAWIRHCLVLGRPLAFGPHLMWAWWLALGFLAVYLVIALLFPRAVVKCAETLEQRPGYSILTAFLVTLLTPAAAILLLITIIGTPALILCLFVALFFGKAVMLAWIGRRITRLFGNGPLSQPVIAVLIGGIIVLLLYTIPFVGFIVSKLISWLGLGVVVYTLIQGSKRQRPVAAPVAVVASPGLAPGDVDGSAATAAVAEPSVVSAAPAVAAVPPVLSAAVLPRAGFWIRIAASALDVLIVAVTLSLIPHFLGAWRPDFLLVYATYCIVLWALRGATIGGIVCSLKVVRVDDRPMDWPTALVRGLGAFLSLIAVGLGFIWVAFDDQKQSWHDKIAGTTIVRVPRGVSLI